MIRALQSVLVCLLALTGCALAPDRVSNGYSHASHLFSGWPFGPESEEATLDTLDCEAEWRRGPYTVRVGLGYMLRDGDFYGDPIIVTTRVSRDIWRR